MKPNYIPFPSPYEEMKIKKGDLDNLIRQPYFTRVYGTGIKIRDPKKKYQPLENLNFKFSYLDTAKTEKRRRRGSLLTRRDYVDFTMFLLNVNNETDLINLGYFEYASESNFSPEHTCELPYNIQAGTYRLYLSYRNKREEELFIAADTDVIVVPEDTFLPLYFGKEGSEPLVQMMNPSTDIVLYLPWFDRRAKSSYKQATIKYVFVSEEQDYEEIFKNPSGLIKSLAQGYSYVKAPFPSTLKTIEEIQNVKIVFEHNDDSNKNLQTVWTRKEWTKQDSGETDHDHVVVQPFDKATLISKFKSKNPGDDVNFDLKLEGKTSGTQKISYYYYLNGVRQGESRSVAFQKSTIASSLQLSIPKKTVPGKAKIELVEEHTLFVFASAEIEILPKYGKAELTFSTARKTKQTQIFYKGQEIKIQLRTENRWASNTYPIFVLDNKKLTPPNVDRNGTFFQVDLKVAEALAKGQHTVTVYQNEDDFKNKSFVVAESSFEVKEAEITGFNGPVCSSRLWGCDFKEGDLLKFEWETKGKAYPSSIELIPVKKNLVLQTTEGSPFTYKFKGQTNNTLSQHGLPAPPLPEGYTSFKARMVYTVPAVGQKKTQKYYSNETGSFSVKNVERSCTVYRKTEEDDKFELILKHTPENQPTYIQRYTHINIKTTKKSIPIPIVLEKQMGPGKGKFSFTAQSLPNELYELELSWEDKYKNVINTSFDNVPIFSSNSAIAVRTQSQVSQTTNNQRTETKRSTTRLPKLNSKIEEFYNDPQWKDRLIAIRRIVSKLFVANPQSDQALIKTLTTNYRKAYKRALQKIHPDRFESKKKENPDYYNTSTELTKFLVSVNTKLNNNEIPPVTQKELREWIGEVPGERGGFVAGLPNIFTRSAPAVEEGVYSELKYQEERALGIKVQKTLNQMGNDECKEIPSFQRTYDGGEERFFKRVNLYIIEFDDGMFWPCTYYGWKKKKTYARFYLKPNQNDEATFSSGELTYPIYPSMVKRVWEISNKKSFWAKFESSPKNQVALASQGGQAAIPKTIKLDTEEIIVKEEKLGGGKTLYPNRFYSVFFEIKVKNKTNKKAFIGKFQGTLRYKQTTYCMFILPAKNFPKRGGRYYGYDLKFLKKASLFKEFVDLDVLNQFQDRADNMQKGAIFSYKDKSYYQYKEEQPYKLELESMQAKQISRENMSSRAKSITFTEEDFAIEEREDNDWYAEGLG